MRTQLFIEHFPQAFAFTAVMAEEKNFFAALFGALRFRRRTRDSAGESRGRLKSKIKHILCRKRVVADEVTLHA